jgi:broad specificity phosphatase PhoE
LVRELIVVRHGESEGNVLGIALGARPYPLTGRGRGQARAVARVVDGFGWRPERVVASPVARCVETATIIAGALGLPAPAEDAAFTEIDSGEATGRRFEDLARDFPELFARPPSEWTGFRAVGGEDDTDLFARVREGLDRLPADESVLLVTHGAVFKGVLFHLLGFRPPYFLDLRCGTCLRLARRTIAGAEVLAFTHFLHADEWEVPGAPGGA